ncbi:MAG: hypothetical protein PW734_07700 [Verrucomicrobium sp.]|nr:hypothetical protein [Verrucomicrobium sp.]
MRKPPALLLGIALASGVGGLVAARQHLLPGIDAELHKSSAPEPTFQRLPDPPPKDAATLAREHAADRGGKIDLTTTAPRIPLTATCAPDPAPLSTVEHCTAPVSRRNVADTGEYAPFVKEDLAKPAFPLEIEYYMPVEAACSPARKGWTCSFELEREDLQGAARAQADARAYLEKQGLTPTRNPYELP